MNSFGTKKPANSSQNGANSNPFARALAETEKTAFADNQPKLNPFSEALAKKSGSQQGMSPDFNPFANNWAEQQKLQAEKQQKREALRKKLHDKVNPVDNRELFNAREKEVKREIVKLREELKMLSKEVGSLNKEIEMTLLSNVVDPGSDGAYYLSFFQNLRAFIMLLRQKVRSARTWATQMQSKKSKKKKRGGALVFEGKAGHEKTKTIFDMMHHEVSNARSGG